MKPYGHLLLAVDLSADSALVGARARALADRFDARLSLLHVVEYIPVDPAGEALLPPPVELEQDLAAGAQRRLDALGAELKVPAADRVVATGNVKQEIVRVAAERGCDLIVLGSHERHGLAVLLGGTEKSVLNAAPCDVLAVRLR
jgi:universal stress protein A